MKKQLRIDAHALPEEGKSYSGELDGSIFNTDTHGNAHDYKASGPLFYDLYIKRFDTELLVQGALSVPMSFTCVRTLAPFVQTIRVENFNQSLELTGQDVDLTDMLREELVIQFPAYPRCDEADEPMDCNLDSRYLAVDKPTEGDVKTSPADEAPSPWGALDALGNDSE